MIRYYKTVGNKVEKIQSIEEGCWVNCVKPTDSEINYILNTCNVNPEFIRASLDEEESSRIDREEENSLIIIDNPVVNKSGKNLTYYTTPLSIIITPHNIITISLKETHVLEEFEESLIKNTNINDKNRFVLQIMLRVAGKYLKYLKQINKITERVEEELKKSMKNKELIQFLEIEKSLVYFSASLKSIGVMLGRMGRGKYINLNEEQYELLEDVIIEIKQATEMSEIYLNILNGTMDAFASIISNNLNIVMKVLASITLILSIPTIISGIYGMNNPRIPMIEYWWFPLGISAVSMFITWIILKHKNML
ncbi:MAG: magnesium transporter CorA family protein [Clostridia bacterium]|nr:magnesium transporter CorA family protein [Clostridia bacterium]